MSAAPRPANKGPRGCVLGLLLLVPLLWGSPLAAQQPASPGAGAVAIYGVESTASLAAQLATQFQWFGWRALFATAQTPASEPLIAELHFAYSYNSAQPSVLTLRGPLRVVSSTGRADESVVWTTLATDRFEAGLDPRVLALRSAELVRSSLGLHEVERQPVVPVEEQKERSALDAFSIGVGAGVLMDEALGGVASVSPKIRVPFGLGWNVELLGVIPLTQRKVVAFEAAADVRVFLAGLGLGYALGFSSSALLVDVSVGAAAALLATEGRADQFEVRDETLSTVFGYGGVSVSHPLFSRLSIFGGGLLGIAVPAANIQFAGKRVASWGTPALLFSAGLEMR